MASIITEPSITKDNDLHWDLLQTKVLATRVAKAFSLFNHQEIKAILIKGWAIARLYPSNKPRVTTDIDLAVAAVDFDSAREIVHSTEAAGLAIDLHRELRHLDIVEWRDLLANSRLVDIDGIAVRVLRPEDHLRVICAHWLNDGGAHKERLWDVFYLLESSSPDFDWKRCLGVVSPNRRRWIICTLGLANRYLGLDLNDTPFRDEARDLPSWLIRTVEREWSSDIRLRPLHNSLYDRKVLAGQIGKRLRPNPIRATIEMEGSFDAKTRVFYQVGSFFKRILPSVRRVSSSIKSRAR